MNGIPKVTYKRLPGRGPRKRGIAGLFSRCSLYLAWDHILSVDNHGFSEDYKRFYLSDIQAFIIRKTKRGLIWNFVLGFLIALSTAGSLAARAAARPSVRIFFWVLSGAFFVFLVINLLRGPTCACRILTAVQEDDLPSLNRLRVANKVRGILRAAIESVQGSLSPQEINALASQPAQTDELRLDADWNTALSPSVTTRPASGSTEPSAAVSQDPGVPVEAIPVPERTSARRPAPPIHSRQIRGRDRPIRHYDGAVHRIAFALMVADGILAGVDLFYHTAAMAVVSSILSPVYAICIIIALAKQHESDLPATIRGVTWTSLGLTGVYFLMSYILILTTTFAAMRLRPNETMTQWDVYRALINLSPQSSWPILAIDLFASAYSLVLGTLGWIRVKKHRDDSAMLHLSVQIPVGENQ
jgi:hypothetical protein